MKIQKSTDSLLSIQSKISIPILSVELISKDSNTTVNIDVKEILYKKNEFPWFFVELATQYLYFNLLGKKHPLCRCLYFSDSEFSTIKDYLQACFINLTYSKIETPMTPYKLWQVKVNGISDLGVEVIENLPYTDTFTALLHELYIDKNMCSLSDVEGLYNCCFSKEKLLCTDFELNNLASNSFQKSIDVTSLDISCIAKNDTLCQILSMKDDAYICIDKFSPYIKLKTLCWTK